MAFIMLIESWTTKKAEHQRIDAFELWCWRRLLGVPWAARRSNQSILKETSPGCPLEGLMLKLKLQYFGHLMQTTDSLVKTLMLGKIEGRRRRWWHRLRWLDGITESMGMSLSKLQGTVKNREAWHDEAHGVAKSQTRLNDCTKTITTTIFSFSWQKHKGIFLRYWPWELCVAHWGKNYGSLGPQGHDFLTSQIESPELHFKCSCL